MVHDTASVPAGVFRMGSWAGRPDERPVHTMTVGAFRLGTTPVTNAQYAPFVAAGLAPEPPWWSDAAFAAPSQPVVGITWFEAVAYAAWLGETLGGRWRLPTEAEWERAMRGGLAEAATAWGEGVPKGEIPEGSITGPWPVGRGTPNGFGILDPGTVVHAWCADRYAPYSPIDAVAAIEPRLEAAGTGRISAEAGRLAAGREAGERGPEVAGRAREATVRGPEAVGRRATERKASRGGSWRHLQRWSPPAARSSLPPSLRYADYGFRVLREAE
jgi:formylglycine-generating enzyme required for sulfatase activity